MDAPQQVDGIRYIKDKHKIGLRMDCQDVGKYTKTVPYDKLTDCDIQEPAGAAGPCCCMIQNTLSSCGTGGGIRRDFFANIGSLILHLRQTDFKSEADSPRRVPLLAHGSFGSSSGYLFLSAFELTLWQ